MNGTARGKEEITHSESRTGARRWLSQWSTTTQDKHNHGNATNGPRSHSHGFLRFCGRIRIFKRPVFGRWRIICIEEPPRVTRSEPRRRTELPTSPTFRRLSSRGATQGSRARIVPQVSLINYYRTELATLIAVQQVSRHQQPLREQRESPCGHNALVPHFHITQPPPTVLRSPSPQQDFWRLEARPLAEVPALPLSPPTSSLSSSPSSSTDRFLVT